MENYRKYLLIMPVRLQRKPLGYPRLYGIPDVFLTRLPYNIVMNDSQRSHISFLLRLWQVESQSIPVWRASLEDPATGERKGFADMEALMQYLNSVTHKMDWLESQKEQASRFLFSIPTNVKGDEQ